MTHAIVEPQLSTAEIEDRMYSRAEQEYRDAWPLFAAAISVVTGWNGVEDIAKFMTETLVSNLGSWGGNDVRPPCWADHVRMELDPWLAWLQERFNQPFTAEEIQLYTEAYYKVAFRKD